jgi:hypothetical protein
VIGVEGVIGMVLRVSSYYWKYCREECKRVFVVTVKERKTLSPCSNVREVINISGMLSLNEQD